MLSRKKKDKDDSGEPVPAWVRLGLPTLLLAATLVGLGIGASRMRAGVLAAHPQAKVPAHVRLSGVPKWLPRDFAVKVYDAAQAVASKSNVFDDTLVEKVAGNVAQNPWVKSVTSVTKRSDGLVHVTAKFRQPFALVGSMLSSPDDLHVVDDQGYVLPLPLNRITPGTIITIRDVSTRPPKFGQKWDAPELADGLRLLKLVKDKPWAKEITVIDIRNYNGRIDKARSYLQMFAQAPGAGTRTDIRFGRFPAEDGLDYEITPQRKLEYLEAYVQRTGGRLAGVNQFIDLRYDNLWVSLN